MSSSSRNLSGRRRNQRASARAGRHIGSQPLRAGDPLEDFDLSASLRASLLRRGGRIHPEDLRRKRFLQRQKALVVFVIDASHSMGEGAIERMKAAKGAILGLLTAAYQNRDQVALVAFREQAAKVLLRPTSSVLLAQQQLRKLAIGGATPFADGLWQGWQLIRTARQKQPSLQPLLVLVSDGEANVPLTSGAAVFPELFGLARQVAKERITTVVVDSTAGLGNKNLRQLAAEIGGSYQQIRELHAGKLLAAVREAEL